MENIATNMQNYIKINFYENGHNICKIKQKAVCGKKWLQNIQNSIKGSLWQNWQKKYASQVTKMATEYAKLC